MLTCKSLWSRPVMLLALIAALAGCGTSPHPFALQDVAGLMPRLQFDLVDQDGQRLTAADFRNDVVLLYFGYTQCPDACPTTLATLERALMQLGPAASQVRVLFVSVDPARDTPTVLKRYVASFGPQFIGLSGDDDALTAIAKRYRVAYSRGTPDSHGLYAVSHSSAVFVFQKGGQARLLAREGDSAQTIAADLRRLLSTSPAST
jgi:protein SCO1/2